MRKNIKATYESLNWPSEIEKTVMLATKQARYSSDRTLKQAVDILANEVRLFGGQDLRITSDLELTKSGLPNQSKRPKYKGVAVYFKWQGIDRCICCDAWKRVADNIYGIYRSIYGMRQAELAGVKDILKSYFDAHKAIPQNATSSSQNPTWWEILDVKQNASEIEIRNAFRFFSKKYHPNSGSQGNPEKWLKYKNAYDAGMQVIFK